MDRFETRLFLLAEDDANDAALMKLAFAKAEVHNPLVVLTNGEEVIGYLKGNPPYDSRNTHPLPFVVLLDLKMPGKDGFQVLEWVRAQPTLRRLIIIILTSSNRS